MPDAKRLRKFLRQARRRRTWYGGDYELCILLGAGDDDRFLAALRSLWSDPNLRVLWRSVEGEKVPVTEYAPDSVEEASRFGGAVILDSGRWCHCSTWAVRELEDWMDAGREPLPDWLGLSLPMSALSKAGEPVGGFPFPRRRGPADQPKEWRLPLDRQLADVGARVFDAVPFGLGAIGWEINLDMDMALSAAEAAERWVGYLVPNREGSVDYLPPTIHDAPFSWGKPETGE